MLMEAVNNTPSAVTAVGGAVAGGLSVTWLARILFKRALDQYDEKHKEHANKLEKVAERFGDILEDLKIKVALLEKDAANMVALRDDIKKVEGRIAVVEPTLDKAHVRIDNLKKAINS